MVRHTPYTVPGMVHSCVPYIYIYHVYLIYSCGLIVLIGLVVLIYPARGTSTMYSVVVVPTLMRDYGYTNIQHQVYVYVYMCRLFTCLVQIPRAVYARAPT